MCISPKCGVNMHEPFLTFHVSLFTHLLTVQSILNISGQINIYYCPIRIHCFNQSINQSIKANLGLSNYDLLGLFKYCTIKLHEVLPQN